MNLPLISWVVVSLLGVWWLVRTRVAPAPVVVPALPASLRDPHPTSHDMRRTE